MSPSGNGEEKICSDEEDTWEIVQGTSEVHSLSEVKKGELGSTVVNEECAENNSNEGSQKSWDERELVAGFENELVILLHEEAVEEAEVISRVETVPNSRAQEGDVAGHCSLSGVLLSDCRRANSEVNIVLEPNLARGIPMLKLFLDGISKFEVERSDTDDLLESLNNSFGLAIIVESTRGGAGVSEKPSSVVSGSVELHRDVEVPNLVQHGIFSIFFSTKVEQVVLGCDENDNSHGSKGAQEIGKGWKESRGDILVIVSEVNKVVEISVF